MFFWKLQINLVIFFLISLSNESNNCQTDKYFSSSSFFVLNLHLRINFYPCCDWNDKTFSRYVIIIQFIKKNSLIIPSFSYWKFILSRMIIIEIWRRWGIMRKLLALSHSRRDYLIRFSLVSSNKLISYR